MPGAAVGEFAGIENPSPVKIVSEICKFSHKDILEANGFTFPEYDIINARIAAENGEPKKPKKGGKKA